MKTRLLLFILIVSACDGKLSDEQRRKMREQMELHKIKKVSELEITEAAFAEGRRLTKALIVVEKDSARIDSVVLHHQGIIQFVRPGDNNIGDVERQLIEAYLADESGNSQDNVQRVRTGNAPSDSILYTKPVVTRHPDGSETLVGVWNVWLSQKALIIAMDK